MAAACLLVLGALGAFAAVRQSNRSVDAVKVNIANEFDNYFISERGVTALLTKGGKEPVIGTQPEGPRLRVLEARLKAHAFVRDAQVYRDLAGNLHADVRQNRPIARLTHPDTRLDTYLDAEGRALPLSPLFTARVATVARSGGGACQLDFSRTVPVGITWSFCATLTSTNSGKRRSRRYLLSPAASCRSRSKWATNVLNSGPPKIFRRNSPSLWYFTVKFRQFWGGTRTTA